MHIFKQAYTTFILLKFIFHPCPDPSSLIKPHGHLTATGLKTSPLLEAETQAPGEAESCEAIL